MKKKQFIKSLSEAYDIGKRFGKKLTKTAISAYAGQSAFMIILSFFPFCMFLVSLLKYTPLTADVLISYLETVFPGFLREFMTPLINEIFYSSATTILPITVIVALWLGSRAFMSLINGLNSVYEITQNRNGVLNRILAIVYTLLFGVLLIVVLSLLVFGNTLFYSITKHFPIIEHILLPIISFRSLGSFLFMFFFFSLVYWHIPNQKLSWSDQLPGSLLSSCGWMVFSYLYSFYVDHFSNYSAFYGTMTTIALLMVWLYACMYILFFGGLLNYILSNYSIVSYLKNLRP